VEGEPEAYCSPDHQIIRSPDHPIFRCPDSPMSRSQKLCPSSPTPMPIGGIWLVGPGTALPMSSIFMPSERPIEASISLISLSDLRPKFLVLSISASVFCTSSPMVWMLAFFRQL